VDRDDPIEENHHHENQEPEREVVQKWITHRSSPGRRYAYTRSKPGRF
jgi:hypothetical protein